HGGHPLMARVTVLVGHSEQAAARVQQAEIATPGVDADRYDGIPVFSDSPAQAFLDVPEEADNVPVGSSGKIGSGIVETMDLLETEAGQIGFGGDDPAAAGPEVDGEENGHGGKGGWKMADGRGRLRESRSPVPGTYRAKRSS